MRHGKDFMTDKPGVTDLSQLASVRAVQAETRRIYSVCFSERFESRATVRASELVAAGAIGRVLQTVELGPHRINAPSRPAWFFERARYGGILCDIASHQVDQFLHFTGARDAHVVASRIANHAHPQYPELEDFGELLLESAGCSGYVRVDWFTPDGLSSWGDGRLTILGNEGFIEIRKNVDLAGRAGGDHLFLVDGEGTHAIDCAGVTLPYGRQLLDDVRERSETAMNQAHCFLACELALRAQAEARRLPPAAGARA
jgi:predicted dehydrogenase